MKIAFYAPMKSPFHPVPSGDRRVARLLMAALEVAGYELELASDLRTFDKKGDAIFQEKIRKQSAREADRLIADFKTRAEADRPVAWFSYHLYHKAPDWIGPEICRALNIPYLAAEASHAPKQKNGPWDMGYKAAANAISKAHRIFHMTRLDGECLKPLVTRTNALRYLPPFIDQSTVDYAPLQADKIIADAGGRKGVLNLLSVAMMRGGDKLESYRQLSIALNYLEGDDWQLILVGDGEERPAVEKYLAAHKNRIVFTGELETSNLFNMYQKADLYIWPAHGEAYGMAFLEAQLCGLPVVAGNIRGVPDVVLDGKTGLLSSPRDMQEFAGHVRSLLDDPARRHKMGQQAIEFVTEERSLEKAANFLSDQLQQVIK